MQSTPVKEKGLASFILTSISSPNEKLNLIFSGISTKVNLLVLVLPITWEDFFGFTPSIRTLSTLLIYLWFLLLAVVSTKALISWSLALFTSSGIWLVQPAAGVFGLGEYAAVFTWSSQYLILALVYLDIVVLFLLGKQLLHQLWLMRLALMILYFR